jgi:cysteine-S-conjugate beta-lyase
MPTNFDEHIERLGSGSIKWALYDPDVLPAWVADMDFRSPEPILRALQARVEHGVFGYHFDEPRLRDLLTQRMSERYGWQVKPIDFQFTPNLVSVLNFVSEAFSEPGDEVLMLTPVYPPFLSAPGNRGRVAKTVDLTVTHDGQLMRYEIDFDAFEAAITPRTKLFLLCNPHNPVGRLWSRVDLERLADICLRHNIIIASDEIHCDLLMDNQQHVPMASLSSEVADRTITLLSPSKTFNTPTLGIAYVIAQNETIYKTFARSIEGFMPHVGSMGWAAAYAAYAECQPWLDELLVYLRGNRDYLVEYMRQHFPQVPYTCPEATYLGWLDWRALNLPGESPFQFFLEKARVAFMDGAHFGEAGKGFTRINYATQRERLHEILERARQAVEDV